MRRRISSAAASSQKPLVPDSVVKSRMFGVNDERGAHPDVTDVHRGEIARVGAGLPEPMDGAFDATRVSAELPESVDGAGDASPLRGALLFCPEIEDVSS